MMSCLTQGILENAIKITNEPPTGMHANLHAALDNFDQVGFLCLLCVIRVFMYLLMYSLTGSSPGHSGPVQS